MTDQSPEGPAGPAPLDVTVAHPGRVYDYWLGGKDNFAADRVVAEAMITAFPEVQQSCQDNRTFLVAAVTYAAKELGIRQFVDIGSGLPTSPNTHQVAQRIHPDARVVYVDNDRIVLAHGLALLADNTSTGISTCVQADLRDPKEIMLAATAHLDLSQPVGLMLVAILHFLAAAEDPYEVVRYLFRKLAPGSALILSHMTADGATPEAAEKVRATWKRGGIDLVMRDQGQIAEFFEGLTLVEPGLEPVHQWHRRPDGDQDQIVIGRVGQNTDDDPVHRERWWLWGGVAVKTEGDAL
jgi:hypothetical protein